MMQDTSVQLINKFGKLQLIVAIEELSELAKELCKYLRLEAGTAFNINNLVEEVADVSIMIEQIKIYFGINETRLQDEINAKIERTKQRLGLK